MSSAITILGQTRINQLRGDELPLIIDRMVLALIPGLDPELAVDRSQQMPPVGEIVHTAIIDADHKGYVSPDQVVYSILLGSDIGDFSFNWIGLIEAATDTVIAITTTPETPKRKTNLGNNTTGNNITRNFMIMFQDAQNLTGITVSAETWQFDYQAELTGHWDKVVNPAIEGAENKHVTDSQAKVWQDHAESSHAGRLLNVRTFTASGTYVPTTGTNVIVVEVAGAGGGGGGAGSTTAGLVAVASGGGGGSYGKGLYPKAVFGASQAITIGAPGAGAAAANSPGGPGGASSFGSILSAPGGSGGVGVAGRIQPTMRASAVPSAVATGGNIINSTGTPGGYGMAIFDVAGGFGGASPIAGGGGAPLAGANSPGGSTTTPGAGGGGGCSYNGGVSRPGGAGGGGIIIVYEYS
jgi:hypothetical protein